MLCPSCSTRSAPEAAPIFRELAPWALQQLIEAEACCPRHVRAHRACRTVPAARRALAAEVDGNRTRRTGIARPARFEGGGAHQVLEHLRRRP